MLGDVDLFNLFHDIDFMYIPSFKLINVAGAYWRGDEDRPMLQRIYGTAWESKEMLEDFLIRL